MNIKKIQKNNKKGFTLIETLIAIFILTLSITGPIYISSLSFKNTIDSRDNISVQYLTEEVVEVIKNKRDKLSLSGFDDTKSLKQLFKEQIIGVIDCFDEDEDKNKCVMNYGSDIGDYVFTQCSGNCTPMFLNKDSDIMVYGLNSGETFSKFTRYFYFTQNADNPDEVILNVDIVWLNRGIEKKYSLKESFYKLNYKGFYSN